MTVCPVAIAVGCKKCPIFKMCPVKGVIGDFKPEVVKFEQPEKKAAAKKAAATKPKAKVAAKKK
jgi:predicted transcriptional regulator